MNLILIDTNVFSEVFSNKDPYKFIYQSIVTERKLKIIHGGTKFTKELNNRMLLQLKISKSVVIFNNDEVDNEQISVLNRFCDCHDNDSLPEKISRKLKLNEIQRVKNEIIDLQKGAYPRNNKPYKIKDDSVNTTLNQPIVNQSLIGKEFDYEHEIYHFFPVLNPRKLNSNVKTKRKKVLIHFANNHETVISKKMVIEPDFDDPHIVALLNVSGCKRVCTNEKRALPFLEFEDLYRDRIPPVIYTKRYLKDNGFV